MSIWARERLSIVPKEKIRDIERVLRNLLNLGKITIVNSAA